MSGSTKNKSIDGNNENSVNRKEKNKDITMTKINTKDVKCELDRKVTKEDIKQRATSIESIGQIHSIKIQPIEDENFKYKVVAGRTSFLALVDVLKRTDLKVPEEIAFIEGDADLIAFVENDERKNLSLWEQVSKLEALKEKFSTIETLASELGKSNTWVARRINLLNLSDQWKQALKNSYFPFGISHYEIVATFPEDVQQDIYDYCDSFDRNKNISVRKFQTDLENAFCTTLAKLPWNKDGSEQGCGTCPACLDRKNSSFLFEDMNDPKNEKCMNRQYLQERMNSYLLEETEKNKSTGENILLVSESYRPNFDQLPFSEDEVTDFFDWHSTPKKDGGRKALVVDGPKVGQYIYVSLNHSSQNDDKTEKTKTVRSLAERKTLKHRQRQRKAIEFLMEYIQNDKYAVPARDVIYILIATLGIRATIPADYLDGEFVSSLTKYDEIKDIETLDKQVWDVLKEEILRTLKYGQSGPCRACWEEAEIVSNLIDFELDKAFEEAVKAFPDPKSWAKLEEQENALNVA
jgi:ParB/RepB/Spo0J family partition protein